MISSHYQRILFDVEPNGVATITFNIPKMANALDLLGLEETLDALRRCARQSDIGAVVLSCVCALMTSCCAACPTA